MYPVLFRIPLFGGININTYGVMVALGFVIGILWVTRESKRCGQNPAKMMDLVFWILVAAIVGSRILHVVVSERAHFLENPLMLFQIWKGGLVFYGGLLTALAVSAWYIKRHKLPFLLTFDIFAPAIALGHAVGRIGCLCAGCCYGRVMDHHAWYSLIFPADPHTFAPVGVPLFPTQPIETLGEIFIFAILVILRHFKRFDGQIIATYLMLYAVMRYLNEFLRGDTERGFIIEPWLSTSQFISVLLFAIGIAMYMMLWPRKKNL